MNKIVKISSVMFLSGLMLVGCEGQKAADTSSPKRTIATFSKRVKVLYATDQYELPAQDLSHAKIKAADTAERKAYQLHKSFTNKQAATFTVSQKQLAAAKNILNLQAMLKKILSDDHVIKDEAVKTDGLTHLFDVVKKEKPRYAQKVAGQVTLVEREVQAVALVKSALSGSPDKSRIDVAKKAVSDIEVKAFQNKYLPKLDDVAKKLPQEKQASQQQESSKTIRATSNTMEQPQNNSPKQGTASTQVPDSLNDSGSSSAPVTSTSKVLGVSFISQEAAGAPMGCEAASALEALHYKGHATDHGLSSFLKTMPIAANGNPYQGFGGTPYAVVNGVYQSIFPSALAPWVAQFGGASNISGGSLGQIIAQVDAGNPVIAWVTLNYQAPQWAHYSWGDGIDNAHVVTVDGYNDSSMHVVDPENGTYWISKSAFNTAYSYMKFAVAIS